VSRAVQACSQAIYSALTSPLLSYNVNTAGPFTLPAANVFPRAVFEVKSPPMPMIAFSVSDVGQISRYAAHRKLRAKFWVVSGVGTDECREISEAVRDRINLGDQEGGAAASDLSVTSGPNLQIRFYEIKETRASDVAFEAETNKWYRVLEFDITAI
jgi:hypothetical protein